MLGEGEGSRDGVKQVDGFLDIFRRIRTGFPVMAGPELEDDDIFQRNVRDDTGGDVFGPLSRIWKVRALSGGC